MCTFDKKVSIAYILFAVLYIMAAIWTSESVAGDSSSTASSWTHGYTLILMNNEDISAANKARDYIINQGGTVAILSPPHVMLGWIPSGLSNKLIGKHGIELITQEAIDIRGVKYQDEQTIAFINFFNYVASGDMVKEIEASSAIKGEPLINDALPHPEINREDFKRNLQKLGIESFSWNNTDEMTGTESVALFFVESNGTIDANQYNWTAVDQKNTINRASSGLSWWVNKAAAYGVTLSFTVRIYPYNGVAAPQGYEPILHSSEDDSLWINKIMDNLNQPAGDHLTRETTFNAWLKITSGTNWAYSVFVGYNPANAPSTFTDGYFAYAYAGGPYSQMLFRNNGWSQDQWYLVFAHETGHIFWACDEYYEQGKGGCISCGACEANGPRPTIVNANCEYCNNNSVPCIMRDNENALCSHTPKHIGWCTAFEKDYSGSSATYQPLDLAQDGGFCRGSNPFMKLDSCGNIIWKRIISQQNIYHEFHSIAVTSDGGCVVSGRRE